MARRRIPVPDDLDGWQAELWKAMLGTIEREDVSAAIMLRLRLIIDATSRLEAVRTALNSAQLVSAGSTGQPKAHPLLAVEAGLREELAKHLSAWKENVAEW